MDSNKMETMEMAVKELLEEQAKANQLTENLITTVNNLRAAINEVKQKQEDQQITLSEHDKKYIDELLRNNFYTHLVHIDSRLKKVKPQYLQVITETIIKDGFVKLFLGALLLTYIFFFSWHHWA